MTTRCGGWALAAQHTSNRPLPPVDPAPLHEAEVLVIALWMLLATSPAVASELTGEVYWIDAPVVVEQGPSRWTLTEGYLFALGDDEGPTGVAFVGEGVCRTSSTPG